jgi:hypothetical protein
MGLPSVESWLGTPCPAPGQRQHIQVRQPDHCHLKACSPSDPQTPGRRGLAHRQRVLYPSTSCRGLGAGCSTRLLRRHAPRLPPGSRRTHSTGAESVRQANDLARPDQQRWARGDGTACTARSLHREKPRILAVGRRRDVRPIPSPFHGRWPVRPSHGSRRAGGRHPDRTPGN